MVGFSWTKEDTRYLFRMLDYGGLQDVSFDELGFLPFARRGVEKAKTMKDLRWAIWQKFSTTQGAGIRTEEGVRREKRAVERPQTGGAKKTTRHSRECLASTG